MSISETNSETKMIVPEAKTISEIQEKVHTNAVLHGFWDGVREPGTTISLIHSELSELLEAFRTCEFDDELNAEFKPSDHCPEINLAEEEVADTIIRLLDLAGYYKLDIEKALEIKMKFNETRQYKHGKNF